MRRRAIHLPEPGPRRSGSASVSRAALVADPGSPLPPAGRPAALVLGLDSHGLAIARALAESGVCVYAVEKDLSLPGASSRHPHRVFRVDSFDATDLIPGLVAIRHELAAHDRVSLLAVNDRQVEAIARQRDTVLAHYAVAWADRSDTILRLQRKSELEAVCRQQGLRYPRSVVFDSADQSGAAAGFRFPMILKPVRPLSSFKTLIARDADELARHLQRQTRRSADPRPGVRRGRRPRHLLRRALPRPRTRARAPGGTQAGVAPAGARPDHRRRDRGPARGAAADRAVLRRPAAQRPGLAGAQARSGRPVLGHRADRRTHRLLGRTVHQRRLQPAADGTPSSPSAWHRRSAGAVRQRDLVRHRTRPARLRPPVLAPPHADARAQGARPFPTGATATRQPFGRSAVGKPLE
ncbi:MAG: hypothetical protein MZW92_21430 [Comamonadaceae bacterium]|nr:hypothetical protein [Comamonadaceae bacterium]